FTGRVAPYLQIDCDPTLGWEHAGRGKGTLIDRARVIAGHMHLAEHRRREGTGLDQPGRGDVDNVSAFCACQPLRAVAQVRDREGRSGDRREAREYVAVRAV